MDYNRRDSHTIMSWLAFGWVPRETPEGDRVLRILKQAQDSDPNTFTYEFDKAVQRTLERVPNGPHCLMLSSGMDSRAILTALRRHLDASDLVAASYGIPGSKEVVGAARAASWANINHEVLDIATLKWTGVGDYLDDGGTIHGLFGPAYLGWSLQQHVGARYVFWNGFMGGSSTGSRLPSPSSRTWQQALARFVNRNLRGVRTFLPTGVAPEVLLPSRPPAGRARLDDQADLAYRQQCCIRPSNIFAPFTVAAPFDDEGWLDYALGLSSRWRVGQRLFHVAMHHSTPELFPTPPRRRPMKHVIRDAPGGVLLMRGRARLGSGRLSTQEGRHYSADELLAKSEVRELVASGLRSIENVAPWLNLHPWWELFAGTSRGRQYRALLHLAAVGLAIATNDKGPAY